MEGSASIGKDGEKKLRGRFMGKLFKEKKEATSQDEVDDFLRGPSDKLHMMPAAPSPSFPPPLTRIDTGRAPRWPTATEVQSLRRRRSTSQRRARKGLVVRFSDEQPEVIGEGGDEATSPVAEMRKRAHTHPQRQQQHLDQNSSDHREISAPDYGEDFADSLDTFRPGPIRRTQTGFESIQDKKSRAEQDVERKTHSSQALSESQYPDLLKAGRDRRSFAERVKAEMRSGEGLALVQSHGENELSTRPGPSADVDTIPHTEEVQLNMFRNSQIPRVLDIPTEDNSNRPYTPHDPQISNHLTESPAALSRSSPLERARQQGLLSKYSQNTYYLTESPASVSNSSSINLQNGSQMARSYSQSPASLSQTSTLTLQEAAIAVGDDALQEFSRRTTHLFTLFRLSTEVRKPVTTCSLEDLTRAALWWFIKGRLNLEATIRDRSSTAEAQKISLFVRQQAYADLAKSLWLTETVIANRPDAQPRRGATDSRAPLTDVFDSRQTILHSLRKLAMSMKRNNILPPDGSENPLTQGLDASIWTQDDGNRSLLSSQRTTSINSLSEAFPLGDTNRTFHFSRMFAEAVLVEEAASQQYRCPVLISVVRNQHENAMTVIIVNQDSTLNVSIQSEKARGTTWKDVRWQPKLNTVEINLPRGFILRLRTLEQDFRVLWSTYEYEKRTHAMLAARDGEELVFETALKSFQYFEQTPQSTFPKEPQPHCHLRVFEKTVIQRAATGPRKMHRGFRIGLNTNPKTKALRGIDQDLAPNLPIQFGLLRGDGGSPAFLLRVEDAKSKYTVVSTFDNAEERTRLHTLLTGAALSDSEDVVAEAPLKGLSIITSEDAGVAHLQDLEWQNFRVINYEEGSLQSAKTVLSENLRVVLDFKTGTLTDRINVEPGELKIRLDVHSPNELRVLRQQQQDLTLAVSEAQVTKELPKELANLLDILEKSESTRVYTFPTIKELHLFQAALTGYEVLFDGMASSFNISRRRMVVPIYKKWDAASTRLQIVQKEKVIQLVAFFEKFTHGDCMNFALKSTDIFETSGKSGKFSVRIVDAKFAMPKSRSDGETAIDHKFVCLDMPEYPGEHDDITIIFETEAGMF